MSFLDELDELADQVKDDAQELRNRAVKLLESHAREHPERLFKLLRTVKPVLLRHDLAIVTRYTFSGGLISEQADSFPLRRWGAQALGPKGAVLGLTPLLGRGVRKQARSNLADYTRADPGS